GLTLVSAILWLSVTPAPPNLHFHESDKVEHLVAYAILMFWFCAFHAGDRVHWRYGLAWTSLGVAIEFIQRSLGYRTFEVRDMIADAIGVLVGWMLAWSFMRCARWLSAAG